MRTEIEIRALLARCEEKFRQAAYEVNPRVHTVEEGVYQISINQTAMVAGTSATLLRWVLGEVNLPSS